MRKKDKLYNIQKANILAENIYVEQKFGYKTIPQHLTNEHITYVLGIDLPLNESNYITEELYNQIIQEQLLYENILKSLVDFGKDKINKVITGIKDAKDAAIMFAKTIANPKIMDLISTNLWGSFRKTKLKTLYQQLREFGLLESFQPTIDKLFNKVSSLKGWQKFMVAIGVVSIVNYLLDKIKNFLNLAGQAKDQAVGKIKDFIMKYLSEGIWGDILKKITDFRTYIGWLEPIIGSIQIMYNAVSPILMKFKDDLEQTPLPQPTP